MSKEIVILGYNSVHTFNYIKNIALPICKANNDNITVFIQNSYAEDEQLKLSNEFYLNNGVRVINQKKYNQKLAKIPKFGGFYKLFMDYKQIKKLGRIDIFVLHYLGFRQCILTNLILKNCNKLIAVFWGSDIFRSTKVERKVQSCVLNRSNAIILSTLKMKECLVAHFGNEYLNKVCSIKFPGDNFEMLEKTLSIEGKDEIRKKMGIGINNICITCGYSGASDQNHYEILGEICKLNEGLKSRIVLIFPMTYGLENEEYLDKIKKTCIENSLRALFFTSYLKDVEVARLRIINDIFIFAAKTDAFSGSMQEYFAASSIVIKGKWLQYYELENSPLYYEDFNSYIELSDKITEIVENIEFYKDKGKNNLEFLKKVSNTKDIMLKWQLILT